MLSDKRINPCGLVVTVACAAALMFGAGAAAATPDLSWNPAVSERLIKLPPQMLKKAVDRDYQASGLAAAIGDTGSRIAEKGRTLADLKAAVEQAEGDLALELRHQFLAEKQSYVHMLGERLEMRRKQALTRKRLYETLLARSRAAGAARDPVTADLMASQQAARERFKASLDAVDMKILGSEYSAQSRYGAEYAKSKIAMDSLLAAIDAHPMNQRPMLDGEEMSRESYLRQLIVDYDVELSLMAQEEQILGYMAKLVALDAMALADGLADGANGEAGSGPDAGPSLASAVNLFISN